MIVWFIILKIVLNGRIHFKNKLPVSNTIANASEISNYEFKLILSNDLLTGGFIRITFPSQFSNNLGLNDSKTVKCSVMCSLDGRKLDLTFENDLIAGNTYTASVYNIYNPTTQGGTANFYIQSIKGAQIIDENLKYAVIGIATPISPLITASVSLHAEGVQFAGDLSKYLFYFTTKTEIKAPFYIRLLLPKGAFTVPQFPPCKAFPVNKNLLTGTLQCKRIDDDLEWDVIDVYGPEGSLGAGSQRAVQVSLYNPPYEDITDNFGIALIKQNTNIIYERKIDIEGVTVKPGLINDVNMKLVDTDLTITRNKIMWFRLTFTLSNYLTKESALKFIIPASVSLYYIEKFGRIQSVILEKGIKAKSTRDLVSITYDSTVNIMLITSFDVKNDLDPISILLLLKTPDVAGYSSPIEIASYTKELSGKLVDEDTTFSKITVKDVASISTYNYSLSNIYVSTTTLIIAKARFEFTPKVTVPKNGFIHVILSPGLNTSEINPSYCYVQNSTILTDMVSAGTCKKIYRKIIMKISVAYFAGNTYSFELRNTVISPSVSGYYFADVTTYRSDGTSAIESYTQNLYFSSQTLLNANIELKSNEISRQSIIKLIFTAPVDIISGAYPASTFEKSSFIRFTIEPDGMFPIDKSLGFGVSSGSNIPCRGLQGFESNTDSMECILDFSTKSTITVRNYPKIVSNQDVGILIPGFTNFVGSVKISISVVDDLNGVYTEIGNFSKSVGVASSLKALNTYDYSTLPNYYNISSFELNDTIEVSFDLKITNKINASESILIKLPYYGEGFCRIDSTIECKIQDISYSCYCVEGVDWLLIELSAFDQIPPIDVNLTLSGLKWPSSVNVLMSTIELQVLGIDNSLKYLYTYPNFASASPSPFTSASLILEFTKGAPDMIYKFTFRCSEDIISNSVLILEFPDIYDLVSVDPPISVELPEYLTSGYSYYTSKNKLNLSRMPHIPSTKSFQVFVKGVNTPNYSLKIKNFNVYLESEKNFLIAQLLDFYRFTLQESFTPSEIILESISVYPSNADAYATYTFSLELRYNLSKGSQISIEFPANYKAIPNEPECDIGGAIISYQSCYTSFSTISLILDEDYDYLMVDNPSIYITINNVLNYESGKTDDFLFTTFYDSSVTGTLKNYSKSKVTITEKAGSIDVKSFNYNPQNEGELALLEISFIPSTALNASNEIVLIFPRMYDCELGVSVTCRSTSKALANISCKIKDRILTIYDIKDYFVNTANPLKLTINNIIVPNKTTTLFHTSSSHVSIATKLVKNISFISYNKEAFTLLPLKAPKWLSVSTLLPANFKCRYSSALHLKLSPNLTIPKRLYGGALYVELPLQFKAASKRLRATSYTAKWNSMSVKQSDNTLIVTGNSADFRGDLELKIYSIDNPLDETTTDSFIVRTYDGANKKIVERSFENLDPFSFDYKYPGPLIKVNDENDITVYRGTTSADIPIYIQNQAAFNMTLHTSLPGVMFDPDNIGITIGSSVSFFKISVPQDFTLGTYSLQWTLKGEKYPKIYTPLKTSNLIVVDKKPINVNLRKIDNLPFSGKSLPFLFSLDYAPDIQIKIGLNFKKDYAGMALTTKELIFNSGDLHQAFRIKYSNVTLAGEEGLTSGSVDIFMDGVNANLYVLPTNSIDFSIVSLDTSTVSLLSMNAVLIGKTSASFKIKISKPCTIYYFVGLLGSKVPSFAEVTNRKINQSLLFSLFGEFYIYPLDINNFTFTISGVLPQYSYVMYYYLEDLGGNTQSRPYSITFRTKDRYKSADVSIRLKQTYLTPSEKTEIIAHIATLLSLTTDKIEEKKYFFSSSSIITSSDRLLSESELASMDAMTLIFNFNIIPVPENDIYPSPKELGQSLNDKIDMLAARIQTLDTTYTIQSSEFVRYYPRFVINPFVIDFDYKSATISLQLDNYGWIYSVAIKVDAIDTDATPTAVQISLGLDSYNVIFPSASLAIGDSYKNINITIQGLEALTKYEVYIIAANVHPGYPELPTDDKIKILEVTTAESPAADFLDLSGWIMPTNILLIFLWLLLD